MNAAPLQVGGSLLARAGETNTGAETEVVHVEAEAASAPVRLAAPVEALAEAELVEGAVAELVPCLTVHAVAVAEQAARLPGETTDAWLTRVVTRETVQRQAASEQQRARLATEMQRMADEQRRVRLAAELQRQASLRADEEQRGAADSQHEVRRFMADLMQEDQRRRQRELDRSYCCFHYWGEGSCAFAAGLWHWAQDPAPWARAHACLPAEAACCLVSLARGLVMGAAGAAYVLTFVWLLLSPWLQIAGVLAWVALALGVAGVELAAAWVCWWGALWAYRARRAAAWAAGRAAGGGGLGGGGLGGGRAAALEEGRAEAGSPATHNAAVPSWPVLHAYWITVRNALHVRLGRDSEFPGTYWWWQALEESHVRWWARETEWLARRRAEAEAMRELTEDGDCCGTGAGGHFVLAVRRWFVLSAGWDLDSVVPAELGDLAGMAVLFAFGLLWVAAVLAEGATAWAALWAARARRARAWWARCSGDARAPAERPLVQAV